MAVHAQSNIQLNTIPAYTSLLGGHFVYRAHGTPGTPASANVVESSINLSNPAQWGYNTHIGANGIKLRYNEIDLSAWTGNGLILYNPSTSSQGAPMMKLSANELKFFSTDNSTYPLMALSGQAINFYQYGSDNVAAVLSNSGLNITEGSITLGEQIKSYKLTTDTELVDSKTYYIRTGDGTAESPYIYEEVSTPSIQDINTYYELVRSANAFQVDSNGYLNAQAGWIGGADSYVKLEKDANTDTHYLNIRLSQLDMLLDGDLYGQENIVDVLDIVAQQSDFIRLWNGERIWLYYKDGEGTKPYIVHQYTDNDTGETNYYYNENEHLLPYTKSTDNTVDTTKQYYTQRATKVINIDADSDPSSLDYYEKSGNIYIPTTDITVITGKDYYEVEYIEVPSPSGNPVNNNYYEDTPDSWQSIDSIYFQSSDTEVNSNKTYYIIDNNDYIIVENPTGNPSEQSYYEMLPFIDMAGLSQSLKFTDDSLGNQQKLIVSSANDTEDEKAKVEIDPQYLKFLIESNNNLPLELSLNYDGEELDTNSLSIKSGKEEIFSIEDEYGYALNTTTGFKAGPIGMFHYKNGLAIGLM